MMTTTSFTLGTILWVVQPFADKNDSKRAPGVVLSSHSYHEKHRDIIVARVTCKMHHAAGFAAVMLNDYALFGLDKPSVIKPFLSTVSIRQVSGIIGILNEEKLGELKIAFKSVFPFAI